MSKNTNTTTELGSLGIALQAALVKAGRDPNTGEPVAAVADKGSKAKAAPAANVVDSDDKERALLVAKVKELKLPGFGICNRWTIETLRSKVEAAGASITTTEEDTSVTDSTTTAVVETPEVVVETPAVVVETPEVVAEAPKSSEITEVDGIVVGQILPATVAKKLNFGVLVKLGDNGPTALCHTKELRGGSHHNRKVRFESLKDGDEIAVEVTSIRPPKDGDSNNRHRISVSEKVIQDRDVVENIVCGTADESGTMVTGTVKEVRSDYVLVNVTEGIATGFIGLLHATKVSGSSREERDAKIASYKPGDEITAEAIEVKPRKKGDLEISLSLAATEQRDKVQSILALAGADGEAGETVTGTVVSKKDYGFFVKIANGPAAGRHALVHVSQAPGRNREERDAYVADIEIGTEVEAEVVKTDVNGDGYINIGLSMTSGARRQRAEAFADLAADTDSAYRATVVKTFADGVLVEFGTPFGTFKGKLPSDQAPNGLKRDDHVRVKVSSVDGNRVTLTRRGL